MKGFHGVDTGTDSDKYVQKCRRRPDIDVVRIVLTWAILLFHTTIVFSPLAWYYVKIIPDQVPSWHLLGSWLTATMDVWQMPMFFFLSGIRSEGIIDKNIIIYLSVPTMD